MIRLDAAGRTDRGRVRGRNEDALSVDPERGLVVVADGMGGHPAGDVASELAVEAILSSRVSADPEPSREIESRNRSERMAEAVGEANRRILEHGRRHPERQGMGTTLTVLEVAAAAESFVIGHVGDSRAYRMRDGTLEPLTHDHTPLFERVRSGRMSREAARVHPLSHVLSQALGIRETVEPQIVTGTVRPGDVFLLCTDGLVAVLSEERIEELLEANDATPDRLCERLVEETNSGGGPDNVTVAVLVAGEADPDDDAG